MSVLESKLIQAEAAFVDIISKQSSKCGGRRENIGAYVVHAEEANSSSYRAIDLNGLQNLSLVFVEKVLTHF